MTTDEDFLAAILANPADDLPRLVWADFLEETGREGRAEFIRVQCAEPGSNREIEIISNREIEIINGLPDWLTVAGDAADDFGWAPGYPLKIEHDSGMETLWQRGFVVSVFLPLAAFLGGPCVCRNGQIYVGGFDPRPVVTADQMAVCPDCNGTAVRPGLAADLFSRHPIEQVVATDREPVELNGGGWEYYVTDRADVSNGVPWDVAWARGHGLCHTFRSRTDAAAAMSRALVDIGRERAAAKKAQLQGAA